MLGNTGEDDSDTSKRNVDQSDYVMKNVSSNIEQISIELKKKCLISSHPIRKAPNGWLTGPRI